MKRSLTALVIALSAFALTPAAAQASAPAGPLTAPTMEAAEALGKATGQPVLLKPDASVAAVPQNRRVQNIYPGQCLDLENWGTGRYLQQYPCHLGDNQSFQFLFSDSLNGFEIKPKPTLSANECLDVEHSGTGTRVQRYPCRLAPNQIWDLVFNDGKATGHEAHWYIKPHSAGNQCLDASDYGNGIAVQVYQCLDRRFNTNQKWKLTEF